MNFIDATNNMIAGKRLVRPGFGGYYLAILNGQNYIWYIASTKNQTINASIYSPSVEDILATDWTVRDN